MALCIHNLVPTTCWCCLYGAFAPTRWESFERPAPLNDYPEVDFWGQSGGGGGCPSDRDAEAARSYNERWAQYEQELRCDDCLACQWELEGGGVYEADEHGCIDVAPYVRRPTETLAPTRRPRWLQVEFTRSPAFMGFYKSDLDAIAGHGVDPAFMSVH